MSKSDTQNIICIASISIHLFIRRYLYSLLILLVLLSVEASYFHLAWQTENAHNCYTRNMLNPVTWLSQATTFIATFVKSHINLSNLFLTERLPNILWNRRGSKTARSGQAIGKKEQHRLKETLRINARHEKLAKIIKKQSTNIVRSYGTDREKFSL